MHRTTRLPAQWLEAGREARQGDIALVPLTHSGGTGTSKIFGNEGIGVAKSFQRPAELVSPPSLWRDQDAVFDLEGLEFSESSAVLLQWALASHIRGEILRAGYASTSDFARVHDLSRDLISNFLNGHRRANFRDFAALFEVLGPRSWPDPAQLTDELRQARIRSIGGQVPGAGLAPIEDAEQDNSDGPTRSGST